MVRCLLSDRGSLVRVAVSAGEGVESQENANDSIVVTVIGVVWWRDSAAPIAVSAGEETESREET